MSLAGFKKQFNKANQYVSEKMGAAEGTKLDENFLEMEKKTDVLTTLFTQLISKTKDYLHPNPAVRAKVYMHMAAPGQTYPQTEGALGDAMLRAGHELGPNESEYASALLDVGSSLIEIADVRDNMDGSLHENFLMPLSELENGELKELAQHRKKLQGRRLDYDCKKRKGNKISVEEVKIAQYKFEESKSVCDQMMKQLLGNEVEQIHQLSVLVCSMLEYHKKSADTLERLVHLLNKRVSGATASHSTKVTEEKPKSADQKPKNAEGGNSPKTPAKGTNPLAENAAPDAIRKKDEEVSAPSKPCCKATADFKGEKEGELSFTADQIIILTRKVDDEWLEGTLDGKIGTFPRNQVEILVDLPKEETQ